MNVCENQVSPLVTREHYRMNLWTYPAGKKPLPGSSHQSFTNVIDCTTTMCRGSWNLTSIEFDPRDKSNNHMCHDSRWFFAGAPSAYMDHPLASTLQEKVNICKRNQKSQYQRHMNPISVRTIINEERCYLPDGTINELRDIWTADSTTEE